MTLKEYFSKQGRKGGKARAKVLDKAQLRRIALLGVEAKAKKQKESVSL